MLRATTKEIIKHYNDLFDNVLKIDKEEKYERYSLLCEDISEGLAKYKSFTNDKFYSLLENILDIKINDQQKEMIDINKMFNKYYLEKIGIVSDLEKTKEEIIKNGINRIEDFEFKTINENKYGSFFKKKLPLCNE